MDITRLIFGLFSFGMAAFAAVFTANDLNKDGLRFVLPTDRDFDGHLNSMKLASDPNVAAVRAFSVILINQSARGKGVCALVFDWSTTQSDGTVVHNYDIVQSPTSYTFPRVMPAPGIEPHLGAGTSEFISPVFRVSANVAPPSISVPSAVLAFYSAARAISLTLDLAVFDDGQMVGPDVSLSAAKLQAALSARHDLQVEIDRARFAHKTNDEIFAALARRAAVTVSPSDSSPGAWYSRETARWAAELVNIRQSVGDQQALGYAYQGFYKHRPRLFR